MKIFFSALLILLTTSLVNAQNEYAKYKMDGKEQSVAIDGTAVSSMKAGDNVMLTATDGKGHTVTIMVVAGKTGEYEVTGGYSAPMLTITKSMSDIYNMKSGVIEITAVDGKAYTGKFSGNFLKTGVEREQQIDGSFHLVLDM